MSESEPETKRIFCNCCTGQTHHHLRARYSRPDFRGDEGVEIRASIWSCAGCDEETFEVLLAHPDDEAQPSYYLPDRAEDSIQAKIFKSLNPKLTQLYHEVVTSFNKGCLLLCTIGLRALIEAICRDKGLTDDKLNLPQKIDGLVRFLPNLNLIEALHTVRLAGNDAAHDLEAFKHGEAKRAIAVMEDLLNFLYDLDYKASQVGDSSRQVRDASRRAAFKSAKPGPVQ